MPTIVERVGRAWRALTPAGLAVATAGLLVVAAVPVLGRLLSGRTASDVRVYLAGAEALVHGPLLYRDMVFEYPPYALLWFLVPHALSDGLDGFRFVFGLEMWAADTAIKAALLWQGLRARRGIGDLVPFLSYSLGVVALTHLPLQRYDLAPAVLTFGAVLAAAAGSWFLGGALLALGAGTKVYPALLIPVLAGFARRGGSRGLARFGAGVAAATIPAVAAGFLWPWWRFASYHLERGLQAESLLASVVWALHLFVGVPAGWDLVWRAMEVTGPLASRLAGPGQFLWVAATLASAGVSTSTAWRLGSAGVRPPDVAEVAAVVLLPLAAFVATNTVLSPQFHLWLLPLAALALVVPAAGGPDTRLPAAASRGAWCIVVATLLVPAFYPHREYATGLSPLLTAALVLRNAVLLVAVALLWAAVRRMGRLRCDDGGSLRST